jgi:hypothetical protein
MFYERTLELDWYPPDGDAIAIPIAGNASLTLLGLPVLAAILWRVVRRCPPWISLLAWDPHRMGASVAWTMLTGFMVALRIDSARLSARLGLPAEVVVDCAWVGVWLLLRAVLVSPAEGPSR